MVEQSTWVWSWEEWFTGSETRWRRTCHRWTAGMIPSHPSNLTINGARPPPKKNFRCLLAFSHWITTSHMTFGSGFPWRPTTPIRRPHDTFIERSPSAFYLFAYSALDSYQQITCSLFGALYIDSRTTNILLSIHTKNPHRKQHHSFFLKLPSCIYLSPTQKPSGLNTKSHCLPSILLPVLFHSVCPAEKKELFFVLFCNVSTLLSS